MNVIGTKEAAENLGVSQQRVQALIKSGRLPAQLVGRDYIIQESDLELVRERKTGRPQKENPSPAALAKRKQREKSKNENDKS